MNIATMLSYLLTKSFINIANYTCKNGKGGHLPLCNPYHFFPHFITHTIHALLYKKIIPPPTTPLPLTCSITLLNNVLPFGQLFMGHKENHDHLPCQDCNVLLGRDGIVQKELHCKQWLCLHGESKLLCSSGAC